MLLALIAASSFQAEAAPTVGEVMAAAPREVWQAPAPEQLLYLDLPSGEVVVLLSEDMAQGHVAQVRTLARERFYDGLNFYRVVHGFVAQGGDEAETRDRGRAAGALQAEFEEPLPEDATFTPLGFPDGYADEAGFIGGMPAGREGQIAWLAHCTGAFAFARGNETDSASTEFYITLQPQRYLDRNLTVLGRVIYGMDLVQALPRGAFGHSGVIEDKSDWTPIERMRVGTDVPEAERLPIEMMDTDSEAFRNLIIARSARQAAFFKYRPDHIDLCQLPVPVRMSPESE